MDLGSILAELQSKAAPRPDLITPGSTGALENARPATFLGRMVQPQDSLSSVLSRVPQGEIESGSMAIQALPSSLAAVIGTATPEAIRTANLTSRAAGAVGSKAIVPRLVESTVPKEASILDYGAGKAAAHTQGLRGKGFNVTAHDFGENVVSGLHDPKALSKQYDHVYASNVLNTQSSKEMLGETLNEIHSAMKPGGSGTVNLPMSPRKFKGLDADLLESELKSRFSKVERIGGTKQAPVYRVVK